MIRKVEILALILFHLALGIWAGMSLKIPVQLHVFSHALALLLGFFFADWFSGVVHWACDRIGTPETPVWGHIVKGFRDHHDDPLSITRITIGENLGYSAIAGCLLLTLTMPFMSGDSLVSWTWFWFLEFSLLSNLFHRWSHFPEARRPLWMKTLQKWGVLLRPETHWTHHRKPFRVNYCILSGWANGVTNHTPWRLLERGLSRLGMRIMD